jgi:hypothetical protein
VFLAAVGVPAQINAVIDVQADALARIVAEQASWSRRDVYNLD